MVSIPSATTDMPSAVPMDSMALRMLWLRGRLWIDEMSDLSILSSSTVKSAMVASDE